jgi:hypothetical protein
MGLHNVPDEAVKAPIDPIKFVIGPPKRPNWGLFAGYLGVEGGPHVFLYFFLSLIHQLDHVLSFWPTRAPLGLSRAHFWEPMGPRGP